METPEAKKARLMADAERSIDLKLRQEAYERLISDQTNEVSTLARSLLEVGYAHIPLVLVVRRETPGLYPGEPATVAYTTTTTQFLFSSSDGKYAQTRLPKEGRPDQCFGLTRTGEVRVGFTDNRRPSEVYRSSNGAVHEHLVKILKLNINRQVE